MRPPAVAAGREPAPAHPTREEVDVPIDYTKRPPASGSGQPAAGGVSLSKVTLTKASPTVSLTKHGPAGGVLRVNLNWTSRPSGGGGFFGRREPDIDLDLACLYEFTDGRKGVIQALGNSFRTAVTGASEATIWLDGDDRSGSSEGGENLFVNLAHAASIRRVLIFTYIYEGVPNWAAAHGVVTLFPPAGPQVEVLLDEPRAGARTCAIALLTPSAGDMAVHREVRYIDGSQMALDQAYGWGLQWTAGRK
jgi:tellurite resistance protein TerA